MSAYCEKQNLRGFGRWLRLQSQEEYGHSMKLFDFMIARGCDVDLRPLTAPTVTFTSIAEVFETVQRQEQEVSAQIDVLYELAFREKAFAATVELQCRTETVAIDLVDANVGDTLLVHLGFAIARLEVA